MINTIKFEKSVTIPTKMINHLQCEQGTIGISE
jgi:hypothetical protein